MSFWLGFAACYVTVGALLMVMVARDDVPRTSCDWFSLMVFAIIWPFFILADD